MTTATKITYTSATGDLDEFHRRFDEALARVRAAAGATYPNLIGGRAGRRARASRWTTARRSTRRSCSAASRPPGRRKSTSRSGAPRRRSGSGPAGPGRSGSAVMRRAAELIRERKYDLAALMALEVGKSRLEAMGDAEESADLIDYYCGQVEETDGFVRPMGRITPVERNTDVLRPYGVFVCIAPFNFPLALSTGMSSAALMAGNTVVYKPSEDAPWTGLRLAEIYRDAGLPAGAVQLPGGPAGGRSATRSGSTPASMAWCSPARRRSGSGSTPGISARWIKPCLMELGGKNAAVVTASADLDAAAEGVMRSAFSLQNQKCSATSRVYVDREVADALPRAAGGEDQGDPDGRSDRAGRLLRTGDQPAVGRAVRARGGPGPAGRARSCSAASGSAAASSTRATSSRPTIARLPLTSSLFREELFVPFLAVGEVERARPGDRRIERRGVRPHRRHLLGRPGRGRALLRRDRGRRLLRQQADRRHHRRLARRAGVLRLEGLGLDRQGRLRSVLRRAVSARAEPDGDRS